MGNRQRLDNEYSSVREEGIDYYTAQEGCAYHFIDKPPHYWKIMRLKYKLIQYEAIFPFLRVSDPRPTNDTEAQALQEYMELINKKEALENQ